MTRHVSLACVRKRVIPILGDTQREVSSNEKQPFVSLLKYRQWRSVLSSPPVLVEYIIEHDSCGTERKSRVLVSVVIPWKYRDRRLGRRKCWRIIAGFPASRSGFGDEIECRLKIVGFTSCGDVTGNQDQIQLRIRKRMFRQILQRSNVVRCWTSQVDAVSFASVSKRAHRCFAPRA